tara:strand:+ start:504 stop:1346 length:843 start_codon:yes stop_codon:yes gene_type:complete
MNKLIKQSEGLQIQIIQDWVPANQKIVKGYYERKISTFFDADDKNEQFQNLHKLLVKWCVLTGVKPLPLDDEIRLFVEYVAEHFYRLSLMEIDNAFNLATSGKLNIDANHYQSFNVIYISSILNAYKDYIGKYILQYRKELEESLKVEPTEQERTQLMIESVLEGFDRFKEERKDNPFGWVSYDFLSRLGVINISNEIKEEIKQQSIEMSLEELKYKKIDTKNKSQRKQISNLIEEITNDISGKQDIVVRNCKNLGLTYYYNYILENNLSLSDEISKCIK